MSAALPVGQQQYDDSRDTENESIAELLQKLQKRRCSAQDNACGGKVNDQSTYKKYTCAAQEQKCFCAVYFFDVYRRKGLLGNDWNRLSLLPDVKECAVQCGNRNHEEQIEPEDV